MVVVYQLYIVIFVVVEDYKIAVDNKVVVVVELTVVGIDYMC